MGKANSVCTCGDIVCAFRRRDSAFPLGCRDVLPEHVKCYTTLCQQGQDKLTALAVAMAPSFARFPLDGESLAHWAIDVQCAKAYAVTRYKEADCKTDHFVYADALEAIKTNHFELVRTVCGTAGKRDKALCLRVAVEGGYYESTRALLQVGARIDSRLLKWLMARQAYDFVARLVHQHHLRPGLEFWYRLRHSDPQSWAELKQKTFRPRCNTA